MKYKLIFSVCCFFLIFSTSDDDNISVEMERIDDETINISWSVQYEEYDKLLLEIEHLNDYFAFQLTSKIGEIPLCCYPDEVLAILSVQITKAIDQTDESCGAVQCIEFIKEKYQNTAFLSAVPVKTTTTTTTSTCLLYTSPSPRDS